jgi:hypothetical protein
MYINNLSPVHLTIDNYNVFSASNVNDINVNHEWFVYSDDFGWDVTINNAHSTICENYYFYIEAKYPDAFAHWMYESAIYLYLYIKLKEIYPTLKIYTKIKRRYKDVTYRAFNIKESDISYTIENTNNIVLFPSYLTCFTKTINDNHRLYLMNFRNYLTEVDAIKKDISILYFPRGKLENYKGNDRTILNQGDIENLVKTYPNSYVYYTDTTTTDMRDQIKLLQRANIFICDYGSNFSFNSFFCNDSNIIILGLEDAHKIFPYSLIIHDITEKKNKSITFIPKENDKLIFSINRLKEIIKELGLDPVII